MEDDENNLLNLQMANIVSSSKLFSVQQRNSESNAFCMLLPR